MKAVNKDLKTKKKFADNHVNNILRIFMVEQIFLLGQVTGSMVVSNKLVYMSYITSC